MQGVGHVSAFSEVARGGNTPQWTGRYSHLRSKEANFRWTKDRIF